MPRSPRSRNWVFTLNNPSGLLDGDYLDWMDKITYLCYGEETGDSGTPHFQGYVEWNEKATLKTCKDFLYEAHWEPRRGTQMEAINYCKKEGDPLLFHEHGTLKQQGKRTDLEEMYKDALSLMSLSELQDKHPSNYMRYPKAVDRVRFNATVNKTRTRMPTVAVLYGSTGTGKTHYCTTNSPDAYILESPSSKNGTLWWDGYDFHDTVIVDEFYGWIKFSKLLRICDKYNCKVEIKGGTTALLAENFYFTSNSHPATWYPNVPNWNAFVRRVSIWSYWWMEDGVRMHSDHSTYEEFCDVVEHYEGPLPLKPPPYTPSDGCTRQDNAPPQKRQKIINSHN